MISTTAEGSTLLLDEYFDSADERLLAEVLGCRAARKLKAIAPRWYADQRPAMRRMLLSYIDDGCDRPHHRPLVKTLFKAAEAAGDDEAMGHFMVAFDRLVRQKVVKLSRWDWNTRETWFEYILKDDTSAPKRCPAEDRSPENLKRKEPFVSRGITRFSRRTRRYLVRRAFRYFRRLGRKDAERFRSAIFRALSLYDDVHLATPETLLNSWGLLHTLYRGSPILLRHPGGIRVAPGRSLSELTPAPIYPRAFEGCFPHVCGLLLSARSHTVRSFAMATLKSRYAEDLRSVPLETIRGLLRSAHRELQDFGAELLRNAEGLDKLSVPEWLALLSVESPDALVLVCSLLAKHVSPGRLTLAQALELALSPAAPVAELGWKWSRGKGIDSSEDLTAFLALGRARCAGVRVAAADWLAREIERLELGRAEHLRDLFDAPHADVRAAAVAALGATKRFGENRDLWMALAETPYPDVREFVVGELGRREEGLDAGSLHGLWFATLLSVHRGSRAKRAALAQIASRLERNGREAEALVPLAGLLLRSVRPHERRTALAALTRAAARTPNVERLVAERLPELTVFPEVKG